MLHLQNDIDFVFIVNLKTWIKTLWDGTVVSFSTYAKFVGMFVTYFVGPHDLFLFAVRCS